MITVTALSSGMRRAQGQGAGVAVRGGDRHHGHHGDPARVRPGTDHSRALRPALRRPRQPQPGPAGGVRGGGHRPAARRRRHRRGIGADRDQDDDPRPTTCRRRRASSPQPRSASPAWTSATPGSARWPRRGWSPAGPSRRTCMKATIRRFSSHPSEKGYKPMPSSYLRNGSRCRAAIQLPGALVGSCGGAAQSERHPIPSALQCCASGACRGRGRRGRAGERRGQATTAATRSKLPSICSFDTRGYRPRAFWSRTPLQS